MKDLEALKLELEKEQVARISSEKRANDLKLALDRISKLLLSLETGMLVEDENRYIVLVNQHFCNLFGMPFTPNEMIGWDCSESAEQSKHLFADPEEFVTRIQTLLSNREVVLNEVLLLNDGRYFSRDYIPVFLEGNYRGHLWNYRDITISKNTEAVLKRREERYRRIIENMNLGLVEVDLKGRIRYANQSFCEMSGYSLEELLGSIAEDIFMKYNQHEKSKVLEKHVLRERGISDAYEVNVTTRSGESRWWLISGGPMYDDAGVLIGSVGIHLDITLQKDLETHLKQAKQLAEESSKAKEVFLANMSHEIRTPMNAIMGLSKQLQKTDLDANQGSFLDAIITAADNLLVIINDILDFSKIEAGKMPLEKIGFDLKALLRQTERILAQEATKKGLQFILCYDETIAPVLIGDPFRINQVILNLLSNSIKFTEKGSVSISCSVLSANDIEQTLAIIVEDTGIGMDKQFIESIFEKFSQENVNMARKFGGTGLGMAITHQLVALMNGTIGIKSLKQEGTKVEVRLTLPLGKPEDLPVIEFQQANLDLLKEKEILLVEDNQLNRLVARTILKIYGVKLTEATDGQVAINLIKSNHYDLVLMDMQMPNMDGLEATQIIRSEISKELPIIALTANALKGEEDKCREAGMNDFISKPFDEAKLLSILTKYLL